MANANGTKGKKKRPKRDKHKKYLPIWELEPELHHWLSPHRSLSYLAHCKICKTNLQAEITILKKHGRRKHNIDNEIIAAVPAVKEEKLKADSDETPNNQESIGIEQGITSEGIEDVMKVCQEEDSKYEDVIRFPNVQDSEDHQPDTKEDVREFRPWWLKDLRYQSWCRPVPHNNALAMCIKCKHTMAANIWYLNNHVNSPYHKFHANSNTVLGRAFYPDTAALEIKCSAVIADNNFSHLGSQKLFEFLKNSVPDSESLSHAELNRRRTLAIQKNVIATAHQEKLAQILKESKFAIEIDEATDVSTDHAMCIVVRYYDPTRKKVCDSLWDLKPLYFGDEKSMANAQTIFDNICASFAEWDIPLENIFAFCSDTCSVMMGKNNSVAALLKQVIPDILIVKCDCHIEHLCAKDGSKKVPLNNFSSVVYNYMNSSKKKHMWEVCQMKLHLNPLQILKPICIRWLSHYQCILRLLRRWRALTVFFENEVIDSKDPNGTAAEILRCLRDPVNKAYHMFVEAHLSKLVKTNEALQSERPIVPKTMSAMQQVYMSMCSMYMNEDYMKRTALRNIDPTNEANFRKLEDINIGFHTRQYINSQAIFNVDVEKEFKTTCRQFYIEICSKMRRRCNFGTNDTFVGKFFNIENALDQNFHELHPDLNQAIAACPSLIKPNSDIINVINAEWNNLLNYDLPDGIANERNIDTFWSMVKELQEEGEFLFHNLGTFALQVLCIPNSNAAPERVWSKFNLGKTSLRNRLDISSIRSMLLTAQFVHDEGGINVFQPTEAMINRMRYPLGVRIPHLRPSFPTFQLNNSQVKIYYGKLKFEVEVAEECDLEDRTYKFSYTDSHLKEDLTPYPKEVTITQDLKRKRRDDDVNDFESAMKKLRKNENDRKLWVIYGHDHQYLQKDIELACIKGTKTAANGNRHQNNKTDEPKKPLAYPNGLMSNAEIYKEVIKNNIIVIGRYSSISNHPMRDHRLWVNNEGEKRSFGIDHEFKLFSNEFNTLFGVGEAGFIDGDVMDAFFAIRERQWTDTVCCPVNMSNIICNTWNDDIPNEEWTMFYISTNFTGKVLFPNTRGLHWRLACADFGKKEFWQLDPMSIEKKNTYKNDLRHFGIIPQDEEETRTSAQLCFDNFIKFCRRSNELNLPNAFSRISWTLTTNSSPRALQIDGFNCGIHVMQYGDCIGHNIPLQDKKKFNPAKYRSWVLDQLLENSKNMLSTCLFCFEENNFAVRCSECNRGMHQQCLDLARLNLPSKCVLCTSIPTYSQNIERNNDGSTRKCISTRPNVCESEDVKMAIDVAPKPLISRKSKKPTTYPNGLPTDLKKFIYLKQQIAIGRYTSIKNHPIRDYRSCAEGQVRVFGSNQKFLLFSKEFQKLFGTGEAGYIDGELIDAFCAVRERKWKNVYCCPVNLSSMIFSTWGEREINDEWTMFHVKDNFTGKILFPFSLQNHWYLFVVDVHKKHAWLLDPLKIEADNIYKNDSRNTGIAAENNEKTIAQKCFDNFIEYCKLSKNSKLNTFNKTCWELTSNARERTLQKDGYNCGIILLHYADRIGRGVSLKVNKFDPKNYRTWIGNVLLENSDPMQSVCIFCFSEREREKIECRTCDRTMHITCLKNRSLPILDTCPLCGAEESNPCNRRIS